MLDGADGIPYYNAGGGGGAVGRIRINIANSFDDNSILSPQPTIGTLLIVDSPSTN